MCVFQSSFSTEVNLQTSRKPKIQSMAETYQIHVVVTINYRSNECVCCWLYPLPSNLREEKTYLRSERDLRSAVEILTVYGFVYRISNLTLWLWQYLTNGKFDQSINCPFDDYNPYRLIEYHGYMYIWYYDSLLGIHSQIPPQCNLNIRD